MIETLLRGVAKLPHTRPIRMEIEYSDGSTLVLEDAALEEALKEMLQGELIRQKLTEMTIDQMKSNDTPVPSAEEVRELINKVAHKNIPKPPKES